MKFLELKPGIFYTGVLDPDLRVFDIIMRTEFGTTYNSYLIKGSDGVALIDTAKHNFIDEYLDDIKNVIDIADVKYLVVSHTEPDHSGSIERMLSLNENIEIVGTPSALNFLKEIVNRDFRSITVKDSDTLSLGDKTLTFLPLPNLHWPDTMFTYVEEDAILFTCDAFGAHYSFPDILRSKVKNVDDYMSAMKYYFDMILGPFKIPFVGNALKRIEPLKFDMIATGHGPVLDSNIDDIIEIYNTWCVVPEKTKPVIIMAYVSAYGYTRTLAEEIAKGIRGAGDFDLRIFDLVDTDVETVAPQLAEADGILLGSPTILADALEPVLSLTNTMFPPVHGGKHAAAFGSYGWSGEAVPNLTERLKQLKLKVSDGYRIRFKPSDQQLMDARQFGVDFAKTVAGQ